MRTLFAAALLTIALFGLANAEPTHIRFTLDWKLQGVHAWYFIAKTKGYFAAENLDVEIDEGEGSAATTIRIMSGAYDAGFGDINAIIQNAPVRPEVTPVMVYMIYNNSPLVIAGLSKGPVQTFKDIANHKLGSPAGSAALALLPALATMNGVNPKSISITNVAPNLVEQLILNGQIDVTATYNITSYMNFLSLKVDPDKDIKWFYFKDLGMELYSNGIMVSQRLLREKPEAVRGLVRAINHALKDVAADPDGGIEAVAAVEKLIDKGIEKKRLLYTFDTLMNTKEVGDLGVGDISDEKLGKSIDFVAQAFDLAKKPPVGAIFNHSFLPPKAERIVSFPHL
jgi:NitT/TauT family transport system substrate-binding protein